MERELPTSLLMFISSRYASERIFRTLQAAGFDDVTIAQARLTMGLDPGGTRLSVLADRAQIAKQTATALVDRLERAGYVERAPDPSDGRARLVRMTDRARAALPVARAEEARIEAGPGDYVYVPPYVPHREENPAPDEEAVVVIARSTQEGIVVNLPDLWAAAAR